MRAAGEAVRHQRRPLGALLGDAARSPPASGPRRARRARPAARRAHAGSAASGRRGRSRRHGAPSSGAGAPPWRRLRCRPPCATAASAGHRCAITLSTPPLNSIALVTAPARNATSPSSAPAARQPIGPLRSADAVDDLAALDRDPRGERAAQLEQHERHVVRRAARAGAWSAIASAAAQSLSAVPRSTRLSLRCARHGVEMDDAGGEHDRQARRARVHARAPGARRCRRPRRAAPGTRAGDLVADVRGRARAAGRSPRARPPDRAVPSR